MKRLRFKNDSLKSITTATQKKKKKNDVIIHEQQQLHSSSDKPLWFNAKSIDELIGKPIIISSNDFYLYSDDKNVYFKKKITTTTTEEEVVDDVNLVFTLLRLNSVDFLRNSRDLYFSTKTLQFDSRAMDGQCELELVEEEEGFVFRLDGKFMGFRKVSDDLAIVDLSKEEVVKYSIKYLQYPFTEKKKETTFTEEEEEVNHYGELLKREKSKSDKHCK